MRKSASDLTDVELIRLAGSLRIQHIDSGLTFPKVESDAESDWAKDAAAVLIEAIRRWGEFGALRKTLLRRVSSTRVLMALRSVANRRTFGGGQPAHGRSVG